MQAGATFLRTRSEEAAQIRLLQRGIQMREATVTAAAKKERKGLSQHMRW